MEEMSQLYKVIMYHSIAQLKLIVCQAQFPLKALYRYNTVSGIFFCCFFLGGGGGGGGGPLSHRYP